MSVEICWLSHRVGSTTVIAADTTLVVPLAGLVKLAALVHATPAWLARISSTTAWNVITTVAADPLLFRLVTSPKSNTTTCPLPVTVVFAGLVSAVIGRSQVTLGERLVALTLTKASPAGSVSVTTHEGVSPCGTVRVRL